jgi:hypothetical protein
LMIDANVSANGVELPTDINGVAGSDLRAALHKASDAAKLTAPNT